MSKTEEKAIPPKAVHPVRPVDMSKVDLKKLREELTARNDEVLDALAK